MQLFKRHFGNDRIISRHFLTAWTSRTPDLNQCDFCLWDYLKNVALRISIASLAEMKARIVQQILNMTPETLRSIVEFAVSRFKLLSQDGAQHIEHVLHQFHNI